MSRRSHLVAAWLEGAQIGTLAELVGEIPEDIEESIRMELIRIRDEFQSDQAAPDPPVHTVTTGDCLPTPTESEAALSELPRNGAKGPRATQQRPERHPAQRPVARIGKTYTGHVNSSSHPWAKDIRVSMTEKARPFRPVIGQRPVGPTLDLTGYPPALQYAQAVSLRAVYDALREGPGDLLEISERAKIEICDPIRETSAALLRLQDLGYVTKDGPFGFYQLIGVERAAVAHCAGQSR